MSHLQVLDQDGNPMPLTDFSGQTINFAQNVGPDGANTAWKLIDRLVQTGVIVQADLDYILDNQYKTPGDYQILIVD